MKPIILLVEESKETGECFVRGQTTDPQKANEWAKSNARQSGSFCSTETGFATKHKAFDTILKDDLK